tara:strand:+ start:4252 stop:5073 length:822 start_codon:yes stop_codon:yes gene_type:complete
MNIGIIGQGFVGNAVFEKFSKFYTVYTYDLDSSLCNSTIEKINDECKVVFVCVPTPMNKDGSCDISVVKSVLKYFKHSEEKIIINKSTVIPGTTETLNRKFKNLKIIFNPEFLTERNAVNDYNNQNRIILGGPRPATTLIKNIFSKVFPDVHVIKTGSTHAEMIKYFTNCFLSTKVSFANEMYDLCSKLNLDYDKVVEYASYDNRIGNSHLNVPGPDGDFGFGGHCFPKDLSALINLGDKVGSINNVLKSTIKTNNIVRQNRDWEKMKGRAIN